MKIPAKASSELSFNHHRSLEVQAGQCLEILQLHFRDDVWTSRLLLAARISARNRLMPIAEARDALLVRSLPTFSRVDMSGKERIMGVTRQNCLESAANFPRCRGTTITSKSFSRIGYLICRERQLARSPTSQSVNQEVSQNSITARRIVCDFFPFPGAKSARNSPNFTPGDYTPPPGKSMCAVWNYRVRRTKYAGSNLHLLPCATSSVWVH